MPVESCACPNQQLPSGTLAPNNANLCRALQRAQIITSFPGSIITSSGTVLKSGTYVVPSSTLLRAPIFLTTVYFDLPFQNVPFVNLTIDDFGNTPKWVVHIRNVTNASFDIILKNDDKAVGVSFAVTWNAMGV
jgi:hypothetical protein